MGPPLIGPTLPPAEDGPINRRLLYIFLPHVFEFEMINIQCIKKSVNTSVGVSVRYACAHQLADRDQIWHAG